MFSAQVYNVNPYCGSVIDDCIPIEFLADSFGGIWGVLPPSPINGSCWSPNDLPWMGTPYCLVDPVISTTPPFYVDNQSRASSNSTSSLTEDSCCSPVSPNLQLSPSFNYNGIFNGYFSPIERNSDSKWCFPKTAPPPLPLPGWRPLPYGLERFWMNAFMWLFLELYDNHHLWTLKPVEKPPKDDEKGTPWESVIHSAKVRFNCEMANHGWTSMQGRVVFWFRMLHGIENGYVKGEVVFKLYGQKCDRCPSDAFETALWYPEEIANALWNLHSKVAEKFYGRPITCVPRGLRGGKPLRPHQQSLCQACSDGICRIGKGSQSIPA